MDIPDKYAKRSTLKVPEIAEMLSLDPKVIIAAVEAGELLAMNFGQCTKLSLRVAAGDLIRWMKSKRVVV